MIGRRFVAYVGVLQFCINRLGSDFDGLAGLGLKEGEVEGLVQVKDADIPIGLAADQDFGVVEGVAGSQGLDLVGDQIILQGQVLGQSAALLVAEDKVQVIACQQRAMRSWLLRGGTAKRRLKSWRKVSR